MFFNVGQRKTQASLFIDRDRTLYERELEEGTEQIAEMHRGVKYVDVFQLEKEVNNYYARTSRCRLVPV